MMEHVLDYAEEMNQLLIRQCLLRHRRIQITEEMGRLSKERRYLDAEIKDVVADVERLALKPR